MREQDPSDGVHAMVPCERMTTGARRLWDIYNRVPGAPFYRTEFGYLCLEEWARQGMPQDVPLAELFDYDPPGAHYIGQLGWCEAAFEPAFEVRIVEECGDYEVEQDVAGRHVLYFKGRRQGFMPEYLEHPVKDMRTWQENVKWRLDPQSPARYVDLAEQMAQARDAASQGMMMVQQVIGGYMYLRSLIGPASLLYALYDMPDVIHNCMQAWLALADAVVARHQEHITVDQLFLCEDICYNHGLLIAPEMVRRFLFPYYQQLIHNTRARQIDRRRHLFIQVDTDGFCVPAIPLYRQGIGMDVMSPFEVASGCDVVEIGRQYPDLIMSGGIDKRVLAQGREAIDRYLERVLPTMRARGGYTPTSDHQVPPEVPYQDYLHYRRRAVELGG